MSVSTSSIFHYTKKLNNLIGIINDSHFKLKYCKEAVTLFSYINELAVPMVSFCDIPLASVTEHTNAYGNYGIGMKKEWALRNGINPVFYIDIASYMASSMNNLWTVYQTFLKSPLRISDPNTFAEKEFSYINLYRNMKNYKGNLIIKNGKKVLKDYEYYREREWRYLPNREQLVPYYSHEEYAVNKNDINDKAKMVTLKFKVDDISYIILEKNSQINAFIKKIKDRTPDFYTKVVTIEQIKKDF